MVEAVPDKDSPAVIIYNSNNEPITISHRNLVAASSALVLEYDLKWARAPHRHT